VRTVNVTLSFDMRAPDWGTPRGELYAAAVEMAGYADRIGLDSINLMEHHGSDDGYLPQPFMLASAMAAVTARVRFTLGAVLLPLHEPLLVAEQIAMLDLISKGRFSVILGAGYVPFEFALFGKAVKDRAKLMDEGVDTILRALRGERFTRADGRPAFVRPLPLTEPENLILVGGGVPASARRAARFDVGFGPINGTVVDLYLEECAKFGRAPRAYYRPVAGMPLSIHLCEDPDEGWAAIEPHAVHVITEYAKWAEQEGDHSNSPFKGLHDPKVLRAAGLFVAWTPDQLVERVRSLPDGGNVGFHPLLGGLSPEQGWKSLKLLEQTLPRLREAAAQPLAA
jgi:alkanesulfonate monooxygenase SsuD/methylene tetrahydromethanopterin reductase-like flavin-dependent oxidoreductase (luciferase family)